MMENPWSGIEKPSTDFNVRLVGENHPLRLFWGRDTMGRYLFVYDTSAANIPDRVILPNLTGIGLQAARSGENGKLVLRLNETSNWELFHALCSDLVRATINVNDGPNAFAIIVRRLDRWQDLLRKARVGILPLEAIKGLIGELLFLSDQIAPRFGWDYAVSFWKGPEGCPQDFAVHQTAIEVKCQAGSSKPQVRITSAEQLEPQLPEGYLVVYTIATADEFETHAFTLNELVRRIRSSLESESHTARERFEDLLYGSGYMTREEYDQNRFCPLATKSYKLSEEFPRISASRLSPGIENVSYTLNLGDCADFEGKPDWWRIEP